MEDWETSTVKRTRKNNNRKEHKFLFLHILRRLNAWEALTYLKSCLNNPQWVCRYCCCSPSSSSSYNISNSCEFVATLCKPTNIVIKSSKSSKYTPDLKSVKKKKNLRSEVSKKKLKKSGFEETRLGNKFDKTGIVLPNSPLHILRRNNASKKKSSLR